jgi:hypothetical protein
MTYRNYHIVSFQPPLKHRVGLGTAEVRVCVGDDPIPRRVSDPLSLGLKVKL